MELTARASVATRVVGVFAVVALAATICVHWIWFWGGSEPFYFFDADFYRRAVVEVMTGTKSMYDAMAYPPFAYLLIWWLPSVSMVVGDQIWTAATFVVIIAVGFMLTIRALQATSKGGPLERWDLMIRASMNSVLLIVSMPMFSQLTCGQLSVFVAALAFADVAGFVPKRFQGTLVGLAAAIKVTPMIFAVYYLVTGQKRQAAVSVGSFAAFTAFGALFFPTETLTYWTRLGSTGQDVDATLPYNFGIRSVLERLSPGLGDITWLWAGLGLLLMIVTLWRARKLYRANLVMEAILIVGSAAIIVPPNALPHYFVWLPMAGIWLVMTGTRVAKWVGAGIYLVYSPLYYFVALPALFSIDRIWWNGLSLITLIPVCMGIFGLPRRPAYSGVPSVESPVAELVS